MSTSGPGTGKGGRARAHTPGCKVCLLPPDVLNMLEERLRANGRLEHLATFVLCTPAQLIRHRNTCMPIPIPPSQAYSEEPPSSDGDLILLPVGWQHKGNFMERCADMRLEHLYQMGTAPKRGPGSLPSNLIRQVGPNLVFERPARKMLALAHGVLRLATSYGAGASDTAAGMP